MQISEQVDGRSFQNQIAGCGLLLKRLRHFRARAQTFGQGVGYVGQRISRTVGYDELAFAEQRFGLMPFGDVGKSVHADQEEESVAGFERLLQPPDCVDRVVRLFALVFT